MEGEEREPGKRVERRLNRVRKSKQKRTVTEEKYERWLQKSGRRGKRVRKKWREEKIE